MYFEFLDNKNKLIDMICLTGIVHVDITSALNNKSESHVKVVYDMGQIVNILTTEKQCKIFTDTLKFMFNDGPNVN